MGFSVLTKGLVMVVMVLIITGSQSDSDGKSISDSDSKSSSDSASKYSTSTVTPSKTDTISPSKDPTKNPTSQTNAPSLTPSNAPSIAPSTSPSTSPTQPPSIAPSISPTANPTAPTVCFGKTNEITTKRDGKVKKKRVSDLLIGDQVYGRNIYNSSNEIEWSTVWYIDYHEMDSHISMINISYICDSIINYHQYIVIVDYHLLYMLDKHTNKQKMVAAGELQINDTLMIYTYNNTNLLCKVDHIAETYDEPIYPLTMAGDIIVSNVLASSYIYSREHALEKHSWAKHIKFNGSFPNVRRLICFGKTNKMIIKRDGIIKKIKTGDLLEGDQVYARDIYNSSKGIEWSTVWYIDYHETDPSSPMINISYICDGNNTDNIINYHQYIIMVDYHLLYILDQHTNQQKMVQAGKLQINDTIMIYTYNNKRLLCNVNSLEKTYDEPIFPITISGDIIVSNVVASSYIYSRERALKMHGLAKSVHFNGSLARQILSVYSTLFE